VRRPWPLTARWLSLQPPTSGFAFLATQNHSETKFKQEEKKRKKEKKRERHFKGHQEKKTTKLKNRKDRI
jgi:hypothetical protein